MLHCGIHGGVGYAMLAPLDLCRQEAKILLLYIKAVCNFKSYFKNPTELLPL
jgi:hypothetical protein